MENQEIIEKLNKIAQVDTSWQDDFIFYKENKAWLDYSAEIAIQVLSVLRNNRKESRLPASQKDLAELLGISPQQVNKIVKGNENLTLETISKLERALSVQLIEVGQPANNEIMSHYEPEALVAENKPAYNTNKETASSSKPEV